MSDPFGGSSDKSLLWMVGLRVKIRTMQEEDVEGEVFCYDNITSCVVLQESPIPTSASKGRNIRILRTDYIKDLQVISPTQDPNPTTLILPAVNASRIRVREEVAVQQAMLDASRIGIGVTAEAQEIFNALSKTLPVRWNADQIYVFEEIRISPPYTLEDVTSIAVGNEVTERAVNRVRKVLEGERRRILKQQASK